MCKVKFEKCASFLTCVLLIIVGIFIGSVMSLFRTGGGWYYKFKELEKVVYSIQATHGEINNMIETRETREPEKKIVLIDHRHNGQGGKIKEVIE